MNFRVLTPSEACSLYGELRDPNQFEMPDGSGAIQHRHHPLYGKLATVHDGERIGLVLASPPTYGIDPPGRRSISAMIEGDIAFAHIATIAGMLISLP
jgi:hypothetical protein